MTPASSPNFPPRGIFVVSNRLPVRTVVERGKVTVKPTSGGLASALRGVADIRTWIGWPGAPVPEAQRERVLSMLQPEGLVPVFLRADEERHYYNGMCNGVLWPLLHYLPGMIETDEKDWPAYVEVNRRFADAVLANTTPNDVVWIHDFHLMLVPALLRAERPDLTIGFFLHVPFPSSELWRLLPAREEMLRGLLGADYIGFHTADYLRHFRNSCLRVLGLDANADAVELAGRRTGLGVHPLGPDVSRFQQALADPSLERHMAQFRDRWRGRRLLLGVERLDYTKGILLKLRAFERLLATEPSRVQDTVMLQVLVPSREENEGYRQLLREIQREVGRINGAHGRPGLTPLEFVHRSIDEVELAALYRFADLAVVAPVRDGMNLVAQEFVLCQGHAPGSEDAARGVLVLSEFAGAALSLTRAILVNPWDIGAMAQAFANGLGMPAGERSERMADMHERVLELDCSRWAGRFLQRLDGAAARNRARQPVPIDGSTRSLLQRRFHEAPRRHVFLDYDGTLRELTQMPDQAVPSAEIRELLRALADRPETRVHVVSGRRRNTLESWLGDLPIWLGAEHGFARRAPGGAWQQQGELDQSWLPRVRALLEQVTEEVPGSFLERKPCGIAWHYRLADPGYGGWRARELLQTLDQLLSQEAAEHLHGHAVVEVRAKGADKGAYVATALAEQRADDFVLCAGDDRTDMDMYRRMPTGAAIVHVGSVASLAPLSVATPAELRRLLRSLLLPASR